MNYRIEAINFHPFIAFFAVFVSFLFFLSPVHAQIALDENVGVRLTTNPTNPGPNMKIEVTLDDYSIEASGATLTWYIDGVLKKEFDNNRTIQIKTANIGEKTSVRVVLTRSGASTLSHTLTITPAVVNIIMETDTYVPHFYKGRALPSDQSSVRLIAIVHDGTKTPDTAYTYTWAENGTVLFGGPLKGKNVVELPLSRYGAREFTVEAFTAEGQSVGIDFLTVRAVQPEMHFYEESPLRGLGERTLSNPFILTGNETTIHGEPYFIHTGTITEGVDFTWRVNSEVTAADPGSPNALTLRRQGGSGEARIDLRTLTTRQIPQLIDRSFQIIF